MFWVIEVLTKKLLRKVSIITIFLVLCTFIHLPELHFVASNEEYTYYGVIPTKICQYVLNNTDRPELGYILRQDVDTLRTKVLVEIMATKNDTNVLVYSLSNNSLVSEANLNAMQKHFVLFPNGTMFKVVTNKYASVMLLNNPVIPSPGPNAEGPVPTTFLASTDGAYVGKEFMFMASWNARSYQWESYRIFALENAEVRITREDGNEQTCSLQVNDYQDVSLSTFLSYRVVSTGNIMIQSKTNQNRGDPRRYYFVPSAEGGFVGRVFYTSSTTDWDQIEDYGFRISALQDTKVTIWNLETKEKLTELTVKGGVGLGFKHDPASAILVQSTEPITLAYLHNGTTTRLSAGNAYGSGVAYIGIKPNEETPFFLPTNSSIEAYIFAENRTTVNIDDVMQETIEAGSFYLLSTPGNHRIVSDQNIVIEVIHWPLYPPFQGLFFEGVEIPCIQMVSVVPNVTLTPLEEAFPTIYIIIGVAIAFVVVLGFFIMRRRTK